MKRKLLEEATEGIVDRCCKRFQEIITVGKFNPSAIVTEENPDEQNQSDSDDSDDEDAAHVKAKRVWVMAIAEEEGDRDLEGYACVVNPDGEMSDSVKLKYYFNAVGKHEARVKRRAPDVENIKKMIKEKRPHVILIGLHSQTGLHLKKDVTRVIQELKQEKKCKLRKGLQVLHSECEIPKVWALSKVAQVSK